MNDLALLVRELKEKVLSARRDVETLDQLRLLAIPANGTSFKISVMVYMWVAEDLTLDDGVSAVRPASVSSASPGRYRRITIRMPLTKA